MLLKDKNLSDGFLFFLTPPHPPKEHVTFVKTFEDSLRPLTYSEKGILAKAAGQRGWRY